MGKKKEILKDVLAEAALIAYCLMMIYGILGIFRFWG